MAHDLQTVCKILRCVRTQLLPPGYRSRAATQKHKACAGKTVHQVQKPPGKARAGKLLLQQRDGNHLSCCHRQNATVRSSSRRKESGIDGTVQIHTVTEHVCKGI